MKELNKIKNLSVVLGAGFSQPVGLKLASDINSFFLRDNSKSLLNFPSGEWKWSDFANDTSKNNGISYDKFAYGHILNQWVASFEKNNGEFCNYELFYQYIIDFHKDTKVTTPIYSDAFKAYNIDHHSKTKNSFKRNFLDPFTNPEYSKIIDIFNHLIGDLLYFRESKVEKLTFYSSFVELLRNFKSIDFFTLNHDLILELILEKFEIKYSDGFTDNHSPIGVDGGKKIKFFNSCFNNELNILKLHGSIDVYKFEISEQGFSHTEIADNYIYFKTRDFHEKQRPLLINPETEEVLQNFHRNITPQFITGTRKKEIIKNDSMYGSIFSEFERRINENSNLLIIGYSYSDHHVNEKISSLINSGKKIKVVNVNPDPDATFSLNNNNSEIINLKSISELNISMFQ